MITINKGDVVIQNNVKMFFCREVAEMTGLAKKTVSNNAKWLREAGHAEYAGKKTTLYYQSAVDWLLKNIEPRVSPDR